MVPMGPEMSTDCAAAGVPFSRRESQRHRPCRSLVTVLPGPTHRRGAFRRKLVHDDRVRDLEVRCRNPVRASPAPISHWPSAALSETGHRILGDPCCRERTPALQCRSLLNPGAMRVRRRRVPEAWVGRIQNADPRWSAGVGRASRVRCRTTGGRRRHPETNAAHERNPVHNVVLERSGDCSEVPNLKAPSGARRIRTRPAPLLHDVVIGRLTPGLQPCMACAQGWVVGKVGVRDRGRRFAQRSRLMDLLPAR